MTPEPHWWKFAACASIGDWLFFPSRGENTHDLALQVCRSCEVQKECLLDALAFEKDEEWIFGVRGAKTARERSRLLNKPKTS